MNNINKSIIKSIALVIGISGVILLSGCVNNTKVTNLSEPSESVKYSNMTAEPIMTSSLDSNISSTLKTENVGISNPLTSSKENWCTIGDKVTVTGRDFMIKELVNKKGVELCHAVLDESNGDTITVTNYYFSEDGNVTSMNSTSISRNGSSSASASSSSSVN